jgi:hypothetical protein
MEHLLDDQTVFQVFEKAMEHLKAVKLLMEHHMVHQKVWSVFVEVKEHLKARKPPKVSMVVVEA